MIKVNELYLKESKNGIIPVYIGENGKRYTWSYTATGSCWMTSINEEQEKEVIKKQLNAHMFQDVYKDLDINLDKLGCIMLDLEPLNNMYSIEFDGAGNALYYAKNKERFWIDGWVVSKVAHITLLYGLLKTGNEWKAYVNRILQGWELNEVEIEHIGYFDSPYPDELYWCIVAHIKTTDELIEGHRRLEFLPHINTFTGYKPHMTIAYINKNQGEEYRDTLIKEFNKLWSGKNLKIKGINYGGNK